MDARHLVVLLNVQKDENVHVAFKNCWYCIVLIFFLYINLMASCGFKNVFL